MKSSFQLLKTKSTVLKVVHLMCALCMRLRSLREVMYAVVLVIEQM